VLKPNHLSVDKRSKEKFSLIHDTGKGEEDRQREGKEPQNLLDSSGHAIYWSTTQGCRTPKFRL